MGTCVVHLRVTNSLSLKDKRAVLRSLVDKVRRTFNVSVAEVGPAGKWQDAQLALACVSNSGRRTNQVLSKAAEHIERNPEVEVLDLQIHID